MDKVSKNKKLLRALFNRRQLNEITIEEALGAVVDLSNKVDFLVTHLHATDQTNGIFKAFSKEAMGKLEADRIKNKLPDRPNYLADVLDFMTLFNLAPLATPAVPSLDLAQFRVACLREETLELAKALNETTFGGRAARRQAMADALDALVDLTYFALGTVHALGLGRVFGTAWRRVHATNLQKVRGTGKRGPYPDVIKPEGWKAPNHFDLVKLEG